MKRNNISNNLHFCHIFTSIAVPTIKEKQGITKKRLLIYGLLHTYNAAKQTARTFNSLCNFSDCKLCCMFVLLPHLPSTLITSSWHHICSDHYQILHWPRCLCQISCNCLVKCNIFYTAHMTFSTFFPFRISKFKKNSATYQNFIYYSK